jgi:hypothetical protein
MGARGKKVHHCAFLEDHCGKARQGVGDLSIA